MRSENTMNLFGEMSKAEYNYGSAIDDLKSAQNKYKEALMNDCIQDLLKVQEEEGSLKERDLFIFLRDLVNKVSDVRIR